MAESIHLILCHAGQLRSETLADTRRKLFRIERFGKIIVRLQLESLQAVSLVAAVGKKKDEDMLVRLPDSFCHFKAIEPGHIDVKQDKVRFDKRKLVEGDKTISGIGHFITLFLQEAFQKHGILQVIVSKKNFQWFHELLFIFSISICADYCGMVISTVVPLPI